MQKQMPSNAYLKELEEKKIKILEKAQRLAKQNCNRCHGKGIRTFVVGNTQNSRQDIQKLCSCVTANLRKLELIKKGEHKEDGKFDLKKRVKDVSVKEKKIVNFEYEENVLL